MHGSHVQHMHSLSEHAVSSVTTRHLEINGGESNSATSLLGEGTPVPQLRGERHKELQIAEVRSIHIHGSDQILSFAFSSLLST